MSVSTTCGGGGAPALIGGCVVWTDVVWWRGCFVKPTLATAATSCLCVCVVAVVLQRCLLVLCAFTSPTAAVGFCQSARVAKCLVGALRRAWPRVRTNGQGRERGSEKERGGQRHTDNAKGVMGKRSEQCGSTKRREDQREMKNLKNKSKIKTSTS